MSRRFGLPVNAVLKECVGGGDTAIGLFHSPQPCVYLPSELPSLQLYLSGVMLTSSIISFFVSQQMGIAVVNDSVGKLVRCTVLGEDVRIEGVRGPGSRYYRHARLAP